ncbi:MAG: HAMP domain-containing histidine kinase [Candidatus Nealsonbacteria bacterium]|nr:HAMP domain-containing histidine kinase [Candidatus Nealsonbacteria bacterium]
MTRPWHIWLSFLICLAVLLAAMGWISVAALKLESAEAEAQWEKAQALRETAADEKIRVALWRMDPALALLVAQESARPYFCYSPFLPINRAYVQMFNDRGGGEMLVPSPLLSERSAHVIIYFQFEPDGRLTSPQVPLGSNRKLALGNNLSVEAATEAEEHLEQARSILDREKLLARLPESTPDPMRMVFAQFDQSPEQRTVMRQRQQESQQKGRAAAEYYRRNVNVTNSAAVMAQNYDDNWFNDLSLPTTDVRGVLMTPLWIDGSLVLARRVSAGGKEYLQGCLLNWPAIKRSLLEEIEDLLPEADLRPADPATLGEEPHTLAAIPVRLIPGRTVLDGPVSKSLSVAGEAARRGDGLSPIEFSLAVAWTCMLLAAVAVAGLLYGVVRLSERRASFVTAVTHELRTPLTTFQMYAEMLAEGMVSDEEQQKVYLSTLRSEAGRLTHMVENVLSYARLERGRTDGQLETHPVDKLLEPIVPRLRDRAAHAGLELAVAADGEGEPIAVEANASAVEQILTNLVDNACKYAADAADKRIHLAVSRIDGKAEIRLRDHGPGVSESVRRRLFRSFSKTADEAAHSAPGVGLGLALSRRLARDMGGDLRLEQDAAEGACFVLVLKASDTT